jgi:hypothetical protein
MYGATRTGDGYWGIEITGKQKTTDIMEGQNITWFIKKQRLSWLGHVERMIECNIVQKVERWKLVSKRSIGRLKMRWEDEVLEEEE